jgi:hypothetical protein
MLNETIGTKIDLSVHELNNHNIIAKALTGDMKIHWTTIGDSVSGNKEAVKETFIQVLIHADEPLPCKVKKPIQPRTYTTEARKGKPGFWSGKWWEDKTKHLLS